VTERHGWREWWRTLERHGAARSALAAVLENRAVPVNAAEEPAAHARTVPCDLLVVHDEVNRLHGTGLLLLAVFGRGPRMATVRSHGFYGGEQEFGFRAVHLPLGDIPRPTVYARALEALPDLDVRRILCVPYYEDDARTAVALHDLFGAPLCTWVMDDQNVADHRIGDAAMRELLAKSRLRLAIGPELRAAYEEKYGDRFYLAPPLVNGPDVLAGEAPGPGPGGRPLMVGNVWGKRWLDDLRRVVREAGLELDWTSPSAYRFERMEVDELARDGIRCLGTLEGASYLERLRAATFVLVPTGTLGPDDDRAAVARFSVPSRMPFTLAAAHSPMIVVGSKDTAAAHFVERLGVGRAVPYDAAALRAAADEVSKPDAQVVLRARSAALAPSFSAAGMAEWIWASLAAGAPVDQRFERLGLAPGAGEEGKRWASGR
jgi:hypothetical protein